MSQSEEGILTLWLTQREATHWNLTLETHSRGFLSFGEGKSVQWLGWL